MNILKQGDTYLKKISIKKKFMVSYMIFLSVPLIIFTGTFYYVSSEQLKEQNLFTANQLAIECSEQVEFEITAAQSLINQMLLNNNLLEFISYDESNAKQYQERYGEYTDLFSWLLAIRADNKEPELKIYLNDYYDYLYDYRFLYGLDDISENEYYSELLTQLVPLWHFYDGNINLSGVAKNPSIINQTVGVIEVSYSIKHFEDILNNALVNSEYTIVLSHLSGYSMIIGESIDIDETEEIENELDEKFSDNWDTALIKGEKNYISEFELSGGWTLTYLVPTKHLVEGIGSYLYVVLSVFISLLLIAFFVASALAKSQTQRIYKLKDKMKYLEQTEEALYLEDPGNDEIGTLILTYNEMVKKIDELAKKSFEDGKSLKNTELKLLQAQINPHFLYNSLDNINILAIRKNAPEISSMVHALVSFYKLALNKGRDIIPLSDEIQHVKAYVSIQNIRYQNSVELVSDINMEHKSVLIPKLTLQPIIENCIIHGIFSKDIPKGKIEISSYEKKGDIIIEVRDDGVGIDKETLDYLNNARYDSKADHYGISNVKQRLGLLFGEQYTLRYVCPKEGGTVTIIRIPKKNSDN